MIARWFENTALRIAALVIAVAGATTVSIQLWPSPTINAFEKHEADDVSAIANVRKTFKGRLLQVAAGSDKNSFYRLSTQLVLVEDAIERAKQRKDRDRMLQLRQQKKDIDVELGKLIDQMKKREGMR